MVPDESSQMKSLWIWVTILVLAPVLDDTQGYAAMWWVCSAALLLTIPLLWRVRHDDRL